jgi:putative glutathione S-transferase
MGSDGWPFASADEFPGAEVDPFYGSKHLKDLYFRANPNYNARFTVPIFWDKKNETIVNNESSEIIRILNSGFNDLIDDPAKKKLDFYPEEHRKEIDELNSWVYDTVNSTPLCSVYKPFMTSFSQTEYTRQVSLHPKKRMRRTSLLFSNHWIGWKIF